MIGVIAMRKVFLMFVLLMVLLSVWVVSAQQSQRCGMVLSVVYNRVDSAGYAPRPAAGSEAVFNCIAARDPNFNSLRFPSAAQALNYWFGLYGQELGGQLLTLPAPTG